MVHRQGLRRSPDVPGRQRATPFGRWLPRGSGAVPTKASTAGVLRRWNVLWRNWNAGSPPRPAIATTAPTRQAASGSARARSFQRTALDSNGASRRLERAGVRVQRRLPAEVRVQDLRARLEPPVADE